MRSGSWRKLAIGLGVLAAGAFVGGSSSRAADQPQEVRQLTIRSADPNEAHGEKAETANRYWIGVMCSPAGETLHAQLAELPKDQGLVVEQIVPDGPAAKAGLKTSDILLAAGDKSLAQVADLSQAIESAKESELAIKLLRAGKLMTVAVKPQMQKPGEAAGAPVHLQFGADGATADNVQFFRTGPGVMLPPGIAAKPELPDDMSVDIHREGKKPAKITVKKGEQKWEVTEEELAKLPDDVRRQVDPFVAGGPVRLILSGQMAAPGATGAAVVSPLPKVLIRNSGEFEDRLEKRVNALNKRVDELEATIKELRSKSQK